MGASDAPRRGIFESSGAAASWSPEPRRWLPDTAEDGGGDPGELAASRLVFLSEDGERTAVQLAVSFDLRGVARSGGAPRRQPRRTQSRA